MKRLTVVLVYKTPALGHIPRGTDYFALPRDNTGKVVIMQSWLRAAMRQALRHVSSSFTEDKVLAQSLLLETTCIECQDITTKDMPQGRKITYDCIPAGTQLPLNFLIPYGISNDKVETAFKYIGDWVGLSPRHAGEGYGRFEVVKFIWGT